MRIAHFDPVTGASGDMILGALVDAGAPLEEIHRALATLPLPEFRLEAREVRHRGMRVTQLTVEVPDEAEHRHLPEIVRVLRAGRLSAPVVERSLRVFQRLAEAEARAHGISVEEVHFHEVGALDALVDVAGSALALEMLGVQRVTFSPLRVGTGEVRTAHGVLPVPVPAVLELTRGVPIVRTEIPGEILTPTGAALLTTWGRPSGPEPFVTETVGVACGQRELPDRPNLLRVCLGRSAAPAAAGEPPLPWEHDEIVVLETNLDDMTPEMLPSVVEELLSAGALDAWVTPVLMKKGRPGHLISALVEEGAAEAVARVLLRETTTFGVRRHRCARWKLARELREVETPWGPLRVKLGDLGGGNVRVTAEYESCRAIADRTGRPLVEVYRDVEEHIRSIKWGIPERADG